MRRGELRRYLQPSSPDRPHVAVILSSDGINDSDRPWVLGIRIRTTDTGDILAVPITGHGWAYAGDLTRLYRAWVKDVVGELGTTTQQRIDSALRAALDL